MTGHVYTFRKARNYNPKKKKKGQQGADSLLCTMAQVAGIAFFTTPTALWAFPLVTLPASPNFFGSTVSFALFFFSVPPPPPPPSSSSSSRRRPLPSLPFLRRPIRRLSALLIFVDLLRLLLLSRLRRRRVLPYQRI